MTDFDQSEWRDSEHVKEFVENADYYILERHRQFKILGSFYNHYLKMSPHDYISDIINEPTWNINHFRYSNVK